MRQVAQHVEHVLLPAASPAAALAAALGIVLAGALIIVPAPPVFAAGAEASAHDVSGSTSAASGSYDALDWVIDSGLRQPHLQGATVSVTVLGVDDGRVLYQRDADRPMIPASNMKVVTGAAALSVLGPNYRFETTVSTDAATTGRALEGNLYVRGTGDPSFVSEEMWKLVESIRVLGVERVDGDVVLDASYFDTLSTTSDAVSEGDRAYHARTGALVLNFNAIAVHTTASDRSGTPAVVRLAPETSFVKLRGTVSTGRSGGRSRLNVRRSFEDGRNVIDVSGSVPAGSGTHVTYRNLDDGLGYFGAVLIELLESAGIEVGGAVRAGAAPGNARTLAVHESKPLSLIVRDLNKFSNNFVAEELLKALGAHVHGAPGTTSGGVAVLEDYLRTTGVDSGSYRIEDGCGFSRGDRLTTRTLATVIQKVRSDFTTSYEYVASLSVSGTDGTLSDRMRYPELQGAVRAKTGLLDGVTAISGIMEDGAGEEVVFSIVVNGYSCEAWRVHDFEHSILAVIGRS